MSLNPYNIVKLNYPPLYTKIVAFSSTIDLTQDETKIRSNIEKFIMEKAAELILNYTLPRLRLSMMTPSDDDIRMLRDTYQHCRKWAHAGQVGTNAVTLLAALDELLERRAAERAAAASPTDIP